MAYKDSDELKTDERYPLGDYSFRIERSSVPGSTNDKIEAICTDKDGKNARKSIQVPGSTQLEGWYVEANETEATVYALVRKSQYEPVELNQPAVLGVVSVGDVYNAFTDPEEIITGIEGSSAFAFRTRTVTGFSSLCFVSNGPCRINTARRGGSRPGSILLYQTTYEDRTAYASGAISAADSIGWTWPVSANQDIGLQNAAIVLITGGEDPGEETEEMIVARFAIDLEDAGGDGPGSDWVDPGDYDPDWEEGDPTHTLYVTVTGALSGRHNDPIVDPSYSYIPADKDTVKDYGCGGDGGHGGGGGAGASTVVIHKFATNQANSKEVTAIARRHGYGSGGGKGGKGGDGCILVYY